MTTIRKVHPEELQKLRIENQHLALKLKQTDHVKKMRKYRDSADISALINKETQRCVQDIAMLESAHKHQIDFIKKEYDLKL